MPDIRTIFKVVICFICFFATTTEAQDRVKLGNEAFGRGDYNKAVEYYLLAIDNRPTFGAYVNLGHCYMQLKQWDKAISTYKEAIALNPDDITADIWRSFGRACFEIAQYDNAIDAFQQAFLLEPLNDQEDNIWIARCMIEQKQWIQAEAVLFGELRREPKNTVTLELLAYVFNQQENWPGIINIYTELLGIEPRKTEYRVALAKTLVIQGKKKKAIEMLEYARYVDLNSTQEISLLLADLYLAEEMPREAAECYARVIRMLQNPSSEDYYRLGLAYFQTGDLISSEQVFRNMQKVNPNDFKSDLYLGHVVAEAGRFDEAIALYKDALKKKSDVPGMFNISGRFVYEK